MQVPEREDERSNGEEDADEREREREGARDVKNFLNFTYFVKFQIP